VDPQFIALCVIAAIALVIFVFRLFLAFWFRKARLLAVCPRVTETDDQIVARTSLKGFLVSLTLLHRVVTIDRSRKTVAIRRRLFWIIPRSRTIPFGHIDEILYSFEDWSITTLLDLTGDTLDCYAVKLRLHGDEDVHLFHFFGEGEFQRGASNPWETWLPDWFFWKDHALDMSGSQEADSRTFAELVSDYTGATISPG
jgi:hypothetical protein